jgi:hypothetical protein
MQLSLTSCFLQEKMFRKYIDIQRINIKTAANRTPIRTLNHKCRRPLKLTFFRTQTANRNLKE